MGNAAGCASGCSCWVGYESKASPSFVMTVDGKGGRSGVIIDIGNKVNSELQKLLHMSKISTR
eukprot:117582-Prorocentrum_minimum.AAC.2